MSARKLLPALLAIVVLVGLYLAVEVRKGEPAAESSPSPPAPTSVPAAGTESVPPPRTLETHAPVDAAAAPHALANKPPPNLEYAEPPFDMTPKKGAMTLEDKLAETEKHVAVMETRAGLLEKEIEDLDRAGKSKEAAEQRIVLQRLRAHMEALRRAVAEKREPE